VTLDEAIEHARLVAVGVCRPCAEDHEQFVLWLEELKRLRGENANLKRELAASEYYRGLEV